MSVKSCFAPRDTILNGHGKMRTNLLIQLLVRPMQTAKSPP
jgi:hypothetical protein